MPAGYVWYCGDLRTGKINTQVPLTQTQWSEVMDDAGVMSGVANLADSGTYALNLASAAAPAKSFLAVAYVDSQGNETFLNAGPVWAHSYDDTTGQLQVTAAGLWSYYDHRKVIQVLGAQNPAIIASTYTGMSLGTIAKRLIQLAATHTGGNLPIVLPDDEVEPSDADHTRTYNGYDLGWMGDALRNLTGVINGPEIAFRPRRSASDGRFLEWVMAVGTEENPTLHQTGADWIWDANLPQSAVVGISIGVDGTQMADEAWVKGNGAEQASIIGHYLGTALTDQGYPLLEAEVTGHDTVELVGTLNGYAQEQTVYSGKPVASLVVTVRRDSNPNLAQYGVGDNVQVVIQPGHRYLQGGGTIRGRITTIAGDDSERVTLQLAPTAGSF